MNTTRRGSFRWLIAGLGSATITLVACGSNATPEVKIAPAPAPAAATTQSAAVRTAAPTAAPESCAVFAKSADPFLMRVVDKQRGLPSYYRPADLQAIDDRWAAPGFPGESMRAPAAGPIVEMLAAAQAQGVELRIRSSFRSYQEQVRTFQF